jgi:ketosteroid isomerase-like protein
LLQQDGRVDARELLTRLCDAIDAHDWAALPALLHDDLVCRYVHTGEVFGREAWVRVNAEYPGFDHLVLEDLVSAGLRAAGRCHVTGYVDGRLAHYEVATFITARDGLISEMTEVWTDVEQAPPEGARPG